MKSKHNDITDKIRRNPGILGIEDAAASTGEIFIFKGDRYITSPDNLIFTKSRELFVVEYKSSNSKRAESLSQLRRHMGYVGRLHFNYDITGLYVHGEEKNLQIESIKRKEKRQEYSRGVCP